MAKIDHIVDDGLAQAGDPGAGLHAHRALHEQGVARGERILALANALAAFQHDIRDATGNSRDQPIGTQEGMSGKGCVIVLVATKGWGTTPPKRSLSRRIPARAAASLVQRVAGDEINGHRRVAKRVVFAAHRRTP